MKSILVIPDLPYCAPGPSSLAPASPPLATASPSSAEKLKPYKASTQIVITAAPTISSTALMICTHVVPRMPPMST